MAAATALAAWLLPWVAPLPALLLAFVLGLGAEATVAQPVEHQPEVEPSSYIRLSQGIHHAVRR